jgi:Peptidase A4 family
VPGQIFIQIYGQWLVPTVSRPASGPYANVASWSSVVWVGIDGAVVSADVFQAGTEQDLILGGPFGDTNYYLWTEWYPGSSASISNVAIVPGDAVAINLQILPLTLRPLESPTEPLRDPQPVAGQATLTNVTRGAFTTVFMEGPPRFGASPFLGNTAEWIVETPCLENCGTQQAVFTPLPYLGPVAFFFGLATDRVGNQVMGANGYWELMDNSGFGGGRNGGLPGTGVLTALAVNDPEILGVVSNTTGTTMPGLAMALNP